MSTQFVVLALAFVGVVALVFPTYTVGQSSYPLQYVESFTLFNVNVSAYCWGNWSNPLGPLLCSGQTAPDSFSVNSDDSTKVANKCFIVSPSTPAWFNLDENFNYMCFPDNTTGVVYCYFNWETYAFNWLQLVKVSGYYSPYIYPTMDSFVLYNSITHKYCNGNATGMYCTISDISEAYLYKAFFYNNGDSAPNYFSMCDYPQ